MKAWILESQDRVENRPLKMAELPDPHPAGGEVRVKNLFCGVCRTDIHIAEGDLELKKSPLVLGHEAVGLVDELGEGVRNLKKGDMVGVSWLNSTCGRCKYCTSDRENYCPEFKATGWDVDGGYAEYMVIKEEFAFPLGGMHLEPEAIAPLMCPGIAGYCAFALTGAEKGDKLGIFGFGPTAHYVLEVARYVGIEVYVSTRSERNIRAAKRAGASWAADSTKEPIPTSLDSAIVFPPAGNLVELALASIERGGTLVLAPVSSSKIVINDYSKHLWGRDIRTLYNVNRKDGMTFLEIADRLTLRPSIEVFPFEELGDVLVSAKRGKLNAPNAVIRIA